MGAREVRAGKAYVELFLKDKVSTGLNKASKQLKAWGSSVRTAGLKTAALGTAVTAPLLALAKGGIDAASAMVDMADRTGMAADQVALLDYAAGQSGTSLEAVEGGVMKMQRAIATATPATDNASQAFKLMGLRLSSLKNLSPDEQLQAVADAVSSVQDPAQRAAAAMSVFGRSGTGLIPMLEDLRRLKEEGRKLGVAPTPEELEALKAFGDVLARLTSLWKSLQMAVATAVLPVLQEAANVVQNLMQNMRKWVKAHPEAVRWVLLVGTSLIALGTAAVVLGTVLSSLGSILGFLAAAISAVVTAITTLAGIITALFSPIGLVVAAIVAAALAWGMFTEEGQRASANAAKQWGNIKDAASLALGGIVDAIMAGDLELAWKILATALKLIWVSAVNVVKGYWYEFVGFFQGLGLGIRAAWIETVSWLKSVWTRLVASLTELWIRFANTIANVSDQVGGWMMKRWIEVKGIFDDSTEAERDAAKNKIDEEIAKRAAARSETANQGLRDVEAEKAKDLAKIEEERVARLEATGNDSAKLKQDMRDKERAMQAEADGLKQQLQEKRQKAADERAAAPTPEPPERKKKKYREQAMVAASSSAAVIGSFSAAAFDRLGFGGASKMEQLMEENNNLTQRLVDNTEDSSPVG